MTVSMETFIGSGPQRVNKIQDIFSSHFEDELQHAYTCTHIVTHTDTHSHTNTNTYASDPMVE